MNNFDVLLGMKLGGGGGSSTLVEKTITANGTYNPADDNADGYSSVTANVPNTYDLADEGKVVDGGALVSQTAKSIDANGLYDTTLNNSVTVNVPNTYTAADEGKVVSSGALVSQTAYPSTIVTNGTYDTTLNNSVVVDVPSVGVVVEKDVNFYDYDGTLLYSYTAQEFLQLSELPANPTHSGLTAQGWNWTLADAQAWVTSYGNVDIGQLYCTDDGKTRLYINIESEFETNVNIGCYCEANSKYATVIVNWGDGTSTTDRVSSRAHIYNTIGRYTITIEFAQNAENVVIGGVNAMPLITSGVWRSSSDYFTTDNVLEAVEVGANVTYFNGFVSRCTRLKTCIIPRGNAPFNSGMFDSNYSLQHLNLPNNNIQSYVYDAGFGLVNCYALKKICFPKNAFLHASGDNKVFNLSYALSLNQKIPYWESSTYFDLRYLNGLSLSIPNGCTTITDYAFYRRRFDTHENDVIIPNTVTELGQYAFSYAWNISTLTIPASVTTVGTRCFEFADIAKLVCNNVGGLGQYLAEYSHIQELEIGSGIMTIQAYAFRKCFRLAKIKFISSTPPTIVGGGSAFEELPTTCVIYVPTGSLSAYTSANNYPDPNTYTYVEY